MDSSAERVASPWMVFNCVSEEEEGVLWGCCGSIREWGWATQQRIATYFRAVRQRDRQTGRQVSRTPLLSLIRTCSPRISAKQCPAAALCACPTIARIPSITPSSPSWKEEEEEAEGPAATSSTKQATSLYFHAMHQDYIRAITRP